jgi:Zn-dependent protease
VHEFAHAWTATKLGDDTARLMGRLTLNPLAHLDPVGTLLFLIAGFGWAKPVPVNTYRLRGNPRTSFALVALAGPVSNLILAIFFALLFRLIDNTSLSFLQEICTTAVFLNLLLAFFNLIPVPPLDGSRLLSAILPESAAAVYAQIERYGFMILVILTYVYPSLFSNLITRPALQVGRWLLFN